MREIKEIIVHCSATKEGKNFTTKDLDRWHKERGMNKIGYHWVIYLDGSIHPGRDEAEVGAHCYGHNQHSIGICYIGGLDENGKPKDTRTPAQKAALEKLLKQELKKYPLAHIYGHRNFAHKDCPCFDAFGEYMHLLSR